MHGTIAMTNTLLEVEIAKAPAAALGRLAPLRACADVEIALNDRDLWIRWRAGNDLAAGLVFALPGCRLFTRREGRWYGWGKAAPAFDIPASLNFRPLAQVVFPAPVHPVAASSLAIEAMGVTLVPDPVVRPTLALACSLTAFRAWAETMPACAIERYRAAVDGDRLVVLGRKLPWLDGGTRFWGRSVLVPLGYRPEPNLSETCLRAALGIDATDILVLRGDGCDVVPQDRFTPVSLAALRFACGEVVR